MLEASGSPVAGSLSFSVFLDKHSSQKCQEGTLLCVFLPQSTNTFVQETICLIFSVSEELCSPSEISSTFCISCPLGLPTNLPIIASNLAGDGSVVEDDASSCFLFARTSL